MQYQNHIFVSKEIGSLSIKSHNIKSVFAIPTRTICFLSTTFEASMSDVELLRIIRILDHLRPFCCSSSNIVSVAISDRTIRSSAPLTMDARNKQ